MHSFIRFFVILLASLVVFSFQAEESLPRFHLRGIGKAAAQNAPKVNRRTPAQDAPRPIPKQYEPYLDRQKKGSVNALQAKVDFADLTILKPTSSLKKSSSTSIAKVISSTSLSKQTSSISTAKVSSTSKTSTSKASSSSKVPSSSSTHASTSSGETSHSSTSSQRPTTSGTSTKASSSISKKSSSMSATHQSPSAHTTTKTSKSTAKTSTLVTSKSPSSSTKHSSSSSSKSSSTSAHSSSFKTSTSSVHSSGKKSATSSSSKASTSSVHSSSKKSGTPSTSKTSTSSAHSSTQSASTSHSSSLSTKITSSGVSSSANSKSSSSSQSPSSPSSSPTSFTSSTLTSTSSLPSNTTSPGNSTLPPCYPTFSLVGLSEETFNAVGTPFQITILGCSCDVENTFAILNGAEDDSITVAANEVSFTGLTKPYTLLSVYGLTTHGNAFFQTYVLHAGSVSMPIQVLDPQGNPAPNVLVTGKATAYPGLSAECTTDVNGDCTLLNVPPTTIALLAHSNDNSVAVDGLATTNSVVTLNLIPFHIPSDNSSFDVNNGLDGWLINGQPSKKKVKRDTASFILSTNGQFDLQTGSNAFKVHPFIKSVYINYQFVTEEFPGGYFGTQYNDYYSVTIRTDTGGTKTDTNSMNALGYGAFDAGGATEVFTMSLAVNDDTKAASFDLGVSNVVDNLFDSSLIVTKAGETDCDSCGDCSSCPIFPMCQADCADPPPKTCSFYRNCAEASLECGDSGYPLAYGEKNCNRFSNNLFLFSANGVDWIWGTMSCLQHALVPVLEPCTATCDSLRTAAFDSHPTCYVQNGFCSLSCPDILAVLVTVNTDLLTLDSLKQVLQTSGLCLQQILNTLQGCTGEILAEGFPLAASSVAGTLLIKAAIHFFQTLIE